MWQKVIVSIITIIYTAAILWVMYYLVFVIMVPYFYRVGDVLDTTM